MSDSGSDKEGQALMEWVNPNSGGLPQLHKSPSAHSLRHFAGISIHHHVLLCYQPLWVNPNDNTTRVKVPAAPLPAAGHREVVGPRSENTAVSSVCFQAHAGISVGRIWGHSSGLSASVGRVWGQPVLRALVPSPSQDYSRSFLFSTAYAYTVLKRYQSKRKSPTLFLWSPWVERNYVPSEGEVRYRGHRARGNSTSQVIISNCQ